MPLTFEVKSLRRTMQTHTVLVALPTADHPVALDADVAPAEEEEVSEEDTAIPTNAKHTPMSLIGLPSQRKRVDMSTGVRIRIMQAKKLMLRNRILLGKSSPRPAACLFPTMINSKTTKSASSSLPMLIIQKVPSRNHRRLRPRVL